jgi:hypothetical protein
MFLHDLNFKTELVLVRVKSLVYHAFAAEHL